MSRFTTPTSRPPCEVSASPSRPDRSSRSSAITLPANRLVSGPLAPTDLLSSPENARPPVIRVLTRLADASSGHVLINGIDVKDYATDDLHANIPVLFQTTASLNLTVREFIGVGSADKDFDAIQQAAKEAGIHDAIMKLPLGYDSKLGPYPGPPT